MLRYICDGVDDRHFATCFTVQPHLFQHRQPMGPKAAFSDANDHCGDVDDKANTANIRRSACLNFPELISDTTGWFDSCPDSNVRPHVGEIQVTRRGLRPILLSMPQVKSR
jgi:hypothetical protein